MTSIQYYVVLIGIFEPHEHVRMSDSTESPKEIIARAKTCFKALLWLYYLRHSFGTYDFALLEYLPLLAFSSLRDAENASTQADRDGLRSMLLLSAKGLRDQGRNMAICKAAFGQLRESVKDQALQREISLFVDDTPDAGLMSKEMQSMWPIGLFNKPKGDGDLSITKYLKRLNMMHETAEKG